MKHGTIIQLNGKTVSTSRNLRGVLSYARQHGVASVTIHSTRDGGELRITYGDGATSRNHFESFTVLQNWVMTRRNMRRIYTIGECF